MKHKVIVVMPAYNASKTIEATVRDISKNVVDEIIVVDDGSSDNTIEIAKKLGLSVVSHKRNIGYGGNQKTCYREALKRGADIVVMVHPDYQYDATVVGELIRPIVYNRFSIMFGSRVRTRKEALDGGMPLVKYLLNRMVSLIENLVLGVNFTEHFSGFRAYSVDVLKTLPLAHFSDDFVFDQEFMISAITHGFKVAEYPVPVRYFDEASSITFLPGIKFLLQIFWTLWLYILYKVGIYKSRIFV